jgi:Methyltransferase FkbM domain
LLEFARRIIEKHPVLRRPTRLAFTAGLRTKNAVIHPMVKYLGYLPRSLSDRGQDLWVTEIFGEKCGGFFLDLGAADGFSESNTYILEKRYGWTGICIEPNLFFYNLMVHRYVRTCICVSDLVDEEESEIDFVLSGQESGILAPDVDNNERTRASLIAAKRSQGKVKRLSARRLAAVLDEYKAPSTIDYFSLDVEGAETRILRRFPFDRYRFLALTIERPTPELNTILFRNGYLFVQNALYDTFYVHESIPNLGKIRRQPFEQIPSKGF